MRLIDAHSWYYIHLSESIRMVIQSNVLINLDSKSHLSDCPWYNQYTKYCPWYNQYTENESIYRDEVQADDVSPVMWRRYAKSSEFVDSSRS